MATQPASNNTQQLKEALRQKTRIRYFILFSVDWFTLGWQCVFIGVFNYKRIMNFRQFSRDGVQTNNHDVNPTAAFPGSVYSLGYQFPLFQVQSRDSLHFFIESLEISTGLREQFHKEWNQVIV